MRLVTYSQTITYGSMFIATALVSGLPTVGKALCDEVGSVL
jgi:hypothetical protein